MPEIAATDFDFESYITDIPDYPEPGVVFKDITPLFRRRQCDATGYHRACRPLSR